MSPASSDGSRHDLPEGAVVTLPQIFREIGRRVAKSPKVPSVLRGHVVSVVELRSAAQPDDPKALARLAEAYEALGKDAYAKFGDKAMPRDLAKHFADALAARDQPTPAAEASPLPKAAHTKARIPKWAYVATPVLLALAAILVTYSLRSVGKYRAGSLADIERIPRSSQDPGWEIQALRRLRRVQKLDRDSDITRLINAYQRGVGKWKGINGASQSMDKFGLADIDWSAAAAIPAHRGTGASSEPYIHTEEEQDGTRVGFAPIEICDGLLCGIAFLVVNKSPLHARAAGIDYLAVQVEVFGGTTTRLATSGFIGGDTCVDFWSSRHHTRYTITRWMPNAPVGHITAQTYGPLLFEVLNRDPDYVFIENLKFELPPAFRRACRELCAKVVALRKAQGQHELPSCRGL